AFTRGAARQDPLHGIGGWLRRRERPRRLAECMDEVDGLPAPRAPDQVRRDARAAATVQLAIRVAAQRHEGRVSEDTVHAEPFSLSLSMFLARCSLLADPPAPVPMRRPISSWE